MPSQNEIESKAYTFDPTILREYDIRGQIGKNLSKSDAYALGRAYGTFLTQKGGKTVCVGYDGRESSPTLASSLIDGLKDCGLEVTDIGRGPTPMLWFAVKHKGTDGGIMVTGSHNPPDYNGFKMTLQKTPVFGETIQEIGRISANGDLAQGEGSVKTEDLSDVYVDRMVQDLTCERELTIAWDNGNGSAGDILKKLTAKLPGKHILLYEDIDGQFPNHHPDPTVDKNLVDLQKCVKDNNCDLGIAFDGDGDRIGVVDENGDVLRCDILMTIYAKEVLESFPGAPVIGDVKCSQVMFDAIDSMGGKGVIWKTGHSLIKSKMIEMNAPLAGELSGHIYFADKYYGFDDALYCAVRLMNALKDAKGGLSTLTAHLPEVFSMAEVRFEVDETEKFDLVPRAAATLKAQGGDFKVDETDGIRVMNDDGWWILRPSNTQPVLVARAEGTSKEGLDRLTNMAITLVKSLGYDLSFDS